MGKAITINGFGWLLLLVVVLLVSFLCQSGAARVDELNDYQTKVVKTISNNSSRLYCDSLTPCPSSYDGCISNYCTTCGYSEYWSEYSCVYCSYPDSWDYYGKYCNYNYYGYYYYDDDSWVIWLVIGLSAAFFLGTSIGVALCCVKCSGCRFYRGQKKPLAVSGTAGANVEAHELQQIIGYDAYGRPLVLAQNQIVYPAAPQQLAVPVSTTAVPASTSTPATVVAQPTLTAATKLN